MYPVVQIDELIFQPSSTFCQMPHGTQRKAQGRVGRCPFLVILLHSVPRARLSRRTDLHFGSQTPVQCTPSRRSLIFPSAARIELFLASDKTVTGTLAEVSPDGVTLTRKRDSMQVARSDIHRMWVLGKGSRLKNAGIAALVGFAVGCPIGAAKAGYLGDMNNPRLGTRAGFCLVIGGFAGGIAAGITAPFPATKRTLVYRSLVAKP